MMKIYRRQVPYHYAYASPLFYKRTETTNQRRLIFSPRGKSAIKVSLSLLPAIGILNPKPS